MKTPREIAHKRNADYGTCWIGHVPGDHTRRCDGDTADIENARADGVLVLAKLFGEAGYRWTGAGASGELAVAELGISADTFARKCAEIYG